MAYSRFEISNTSVTEVLSTLIPILSNALRPLLVFYDQEAVAQSLPKEYMRYPRLRCIVDCTEFNIQKPKDMRNQAATWSDYKHHNTVKCLVAITPQGSICYLSELYAGRTTVRYIIRHSKFLDYINPNDQVLADRGFPIREELLAKHAQLVMPPAAKGTSQMTSQSTKDTKTVANVRIHVERVIRRLKCYRLLTATISNRTLHLANDILCICAALTNLQGPLVHGWTNENDE